MRCACAGERWALACAMEIAARALVGHEDDADDDMVLRVMQRSRESGALQPRALFPLWAALDVVTREE